MKLSPETIPFWAPAPGCWRGETLAILGGGRSLKDVDLEPLRGRCRVVAVNKAYQLAPWADMLWGADAGGFWAWCAGEQRLSRGEPDAFKFQGDQVTLWSPSLDKPGIDWLPWCIANGVKVMRHRGDGWYCGLELEHGYVRGNNGVANVLSSIVPQTGVTKVLLLGLDMVRAENPDGTVPDQHWHRAWPHGKEPFYESQGAKRAHRAAIEVDGRLLELGWFRSRAAARQVEEDYADMIARNCQPQPQRTESLLIPSFATMAVMLDRRAVDVVNCNRHSAVKVFRFGRLEDEI